MDKFLGKGCLASRKREYNELRKRLRDQGCESVMGDVA